MQRKRALELTSLPSKLPDCHERDPQKSEIFIVEDESVIDVERSSMWSGHRCGAVIDVERSSMSR